MAGGFRFRLEVVERIRRQAVDAQRRVVADAARRVRWVEQRIAQLSGELTDTLDRARRDQRVSRLDIVSLRRDEIYRGRLLGRIMQLNAELDERLGELARERKELGETSRRLKVVEKLRERQWQRHLGRVHREEQAAADETAIRGFLRGRLESGCEMRA